MRAAVVGGGTAGFMAAAELSHRLPGLSLVHVHDSSLPSIGVGEGTLPCFARWLEEVTALDHEELRAECDATFKLGVRFEGWGGRWPAFYNNFSGRAYAYHLAAAKLPPLLAARTRAQRLDRRVSHLKSDGQRVTITLASGESLRVAFAIDARGFPRRLSAEHRRLDAIPTNAALLRRGPVSSFQGGTRAVARPHGWIFCIPLARATSYGYVHHAGLSSRREVAADLELFLEEEGVSAEAGERFLEFPNFRRRQAFDGALLTVGNAASFLEPLEATAIGLIQRQLQMATRWLGDVERCVGAQGKSRRHLVAEANRRVAEEIEAIALFVAWHYVEGSRFDTVFWRAARERCGRAIEASRGSAVGAAFASLVAAGRRVRSSWVARVRDPEFVEQTIAKHVGDAMSKSFGGFDALSFAQVGHGTGFYRRLGR